MAQQEFLRPSYRKFHFSRLTFRHTLLAFYSRWTPRSASPPIHSTETRQHALSDPSAKRLSSQGRALKLPRVRRTRSALPPPWNENNPLLEVKGRERRRDGGERGGRRRPSRWDWAALSPREVPATLRTHSRESPPQRLSYTLAAQLRGLKGVFICIWKLCVQ